MNKNKRTLCYHIAIVCMILGIGGVSAYVMANKAYDYGYLKIVEEKGIGNEPTIIGVTTKEVEQIMEGWYKASAGDNLDIPLSNLCSISTEMECNHILSYFTRSNEDQTLGHIEDVEAQCANIGNDAAIQRTGLISCHIDLIGSERRQEVLVILRFLDIKGKEKVNSIEEYRKYTK